METLPAWRFDPVRGAWRETEGGAAGATPSAVRIATFNVWFGEHAFEARAEGMLDLLQRSGADVIALQEVTGRFLECLLGRDWVRRSWTLSDATGVTLGGYGMLLLSRLPVLEFRLHALPSMMDRTLLLARLAAGDVELHAGSVHLESLADGAPWRRRQLEAIFPVLEPFADVVLMGDFNFCAAWAENEALDPRYADLWPLLRPGEPGWTVDSAANAMRPALGKSDKRVRFDRILLRSARGRLRPEAIELLGAAPLGPALFPSDHFGLAATLRLA